MKFQVFNVVFENRTAFFKALGYARMQSKKFVEINYSSYENMVKTRLGMNDIVEIKKKLIELRDAYEKNKGLAPEKSGIAFTAEILDALRAFFKVVLSDIDSKKIDDVLKVIAVSKDLKVEELKKALEDFLRG